MTQTNRLDGDFFQQPIFFEILALAVNMHNRIYHNWHMHSRTHAQFSGRSRICQGNHGEREVWAYNGDGRCTSGFCWNLFVHFHAKEGPKVKDSPVYRRQTASCSHCRDQSPLLVIGVRWAGSAHAWICRWHTSVTTSTQLEHLHKSNCMSY